MTVHHCFGGFDSILTRWCERGDLNPHGVSHQILSLARLPDSATLAQESRSRDRVGHAHCAADRERTREGGQTTIMHYTPMEVMRNKNGEPCRDRTYDPLIKSQLLYQLS